MQDGFGLIVGGVSGRDPAGAILTGDLGKPAVADRTSGGLQVFTALSGATGDVDPFTAPEEVRHSFGLKTHLQGGDICLVGVALDTAETVVEMGDDERGLSGANGEEGAQQSHA